MKVCKVYSYQVTLFVLVFVVLFGTAGVSVAEEPYDIIFSTYFGGNGIDQIRDVCADSAGNIYVVGGTGSSDFPTTSGAFDETFNSTFTGPAGPCDAFVSKFSPDGSLVWSTFLGGDEYDRAYAVEVDSLGYVYVAGRAGHNFPITHGVFQETFKGSTPGGGNYGPQNAFIAKLSPDGKNLVWASYFGIGELCRDMDIDDNGDIYVPMVYAGIGGEGTIPASWFNNPFHFARPFHPLYFL